MPLRVIRNALCLAALAATVAQGRPAQEPGPDPVTDKLIERLTKKDARDAERAAAIDGIAERARKGVGVAAAIKPIKHQLDGWVKKRDKDGYVPGQYVPYITSACAAIGLIGPEAAEETADLLVDMLENTRGRSVAGTPMNDDPGLRLLAARTLGQIVPRSKGKELAKRVTVSLEAAALGDVDPDVKKAARESLEAVRKGEPIKPKADK